MAERNDISFTRLDIDSFRKLSEFARKNLSQEQWGLLAVIFVAGAASEEIDVRATADVDQLLTQLPSTDVDQLLTQLREAYIPGTPGAPTRYCIVPVKPPGHERHTQE